MREGGEVLLAASSLRLGYGRAVVLDNVTFEARCGDFWCLLGPNGSGKTSFVRAVLGIHVPLAGTLRLHAALAGRETIGFVPQRCDLNPALPTTVREFVLLGLVGTRTPRREHGERLGWALERVGLSGMERRGYWSLSGGQRQRALVARALVRRPRLLILDEPTSGLDLPTEQVLLDFVARLHREEGLTVLFVTHDLRVAYHHATHVALFSQGTVRAGAAVQMLTRPALEGTFGVHVDLPSHRLGTRWPGEGA